ncbi:hypothetical protein [Spongiactinospora sp. TRM90649]|uniref:hypothetical protein n=1 Tax=Spongiactinospora sp. TRM90649 TaxID=3031114 RepID=UPI0023F7F187|nr:hypothetical protein [Spongiactinospora sp. TRM90649]MDF5759056.1 hypothetical protein [Spongiactinospora sp. TRM90649]
MSSIAILAITGCQSEEATQQAGKTPVPTSRTTRSPHPSPSTAHDAVLAAYRNYWKLLPQAGQSTPAQARVLLKPHVSGKYLDHLVDGVRRMRSEGREPYGQVIPRVKEVWVAQGQAKVIDCQDIVNTGMADATTHERIPETGEAQSSANVEAMLQRAPGGRWVLTGMAFKEAPCTPPSP